MTILIFVIQSNLFRGATKMTANEIRNAYDKKSTVIGSSFGPTLKGKIVAIYDNGGVDISDGNEKYFFCHEEVFLANKKESVTSWEMYL
jgi:hypothetical protein